MNQIRYLGGGGIVANLEGRGKTLSFLRTTKATEGGILTAWKSSLSMVVPYTGNMPLSKKCMAHQEHNRYKRKAIRAVLNGEDCLTMHTKGYIPQTRPLEQVKVAVAAPDPKRQCHWKRGERKIFYLESSGGPMFLNFFRSCGPYVTKIASESLVCRSALG